MKTLYKEDNKLGIINILVEDIFPNPYQPRRYFDRTALEELAASIREYGVIQPITVRKLYSGGFELVSGERRLKASSMAGLKSIPAIVVDISDDDSAVIALLENLQRKDLTFFEEAEGYYNLLNRHGITQEELAVKLGKTQSTIANKLRLLKLNAEIREIISINELTERHARALLRLPDANTQSRILEIIIYKKLNVSKTEELIQNELEGIFEKKRFEIFKHTPPTEIRDYRVFYNTINQALVLIAKSGIEAQTSQCEKDDCYEFVIKILK